MEAKYEQQSLLGAGSEIVNAEMKIFSRLMLLIIWFEREGLGNSLIYKAIQEVI